MYFQDIIKKLNEYWSSVGCITLQSVDLEVGAATFNAHTFLRCLGPEPFKGVYVEPSRRPTDGRYGDNPNRLQHYYQYQVMIKPCPANARVVYLKSLQHLGLEIEKHDIRFVEDNWESPTLGASGLGWEVWLDGMEITQFTYFQMCGSLNLDPPSLEITYGLERLALYLQNKNNVYELEWNNEFFYGDLHHQTEFEYSTYNFEIASTDKLFRWLDDYEEECNIILKHKPAIIFPAYDYMLKCSHVFNLLDARGAISTTQRQSIITRIRHLAQQIAKQYVSIRENRDLVTSLQKS